MQVTLLTCMCGIVGYIGGREAVPLIVDGLRRLEYRGYDSAGVAVLSDRKVPRSAARFGQTAQSRRGIRANPLSGLYGIGHTRWATHGRPTEENAHPHRDCKGEIVVVHNGIVENYLRSANNYGRRPQIQNRNRYRSNRPSGGKVSRTAISSMRFGKP